ncbi:MAG: hypothetical protein JWM95_3284 [Gemmatimonadetes bacterium]|nr:hypothetical protein [Gemmatimonadota bacterium]
MRRKTHLAAGLPTPIETVPLGIQITWLLVLALPIACIAWTVTHEEVFREVHDYCVAKSKSCHTLVARKFFYLFTCEYCFSHYVTAFFLVLTRYTLLIDDWRGYVIAEFALVFVANIYMGVIAMVKLDVKAERVAIAINEENIPEGKTLP